MKFGKLGFGVVVVERGVGFSGDGWVRIGGVDVREDIVGMD